MGCTNCSNCPVRCGQPSTTPVHQESEAKSTPNKSEQQPVIPRETNLPPIDVNNLPVTVPKPDEPVKCVVLVSGGLDSLLVTKILADMGLHVIVYHGVHAFEPSKFNRHESAQKLKEKVLGLGAKEVVLIETSMTILDFVRNPQYGVGKSKANPCLDCRKMNITNALNIMKEHGAAFIASGEVIGQRPMSQRKEAMGLLDSEIAKMGYAGFVLRPLCAKNLVPTIPERLGWIDRNKLYDFSGRTRKPQLALAKKIGLGKFPSPGGGCLLTLVGPAKRILDYIANETPTNPITMTHLDFLALGRHFRYSPTQTIVVARDEGECKKVVELAPKHVMYSAYPATGSIAVVFGPISPDFEDFVSGVVLYYSKSKNDEVASVSKFGGEDEVDYYDGIKIGNKKVLKRDEFVDKFIGME
ncbi:hypothetical protein P9112_007876 [Eukaryota sp. TZLM1-RC]